MPNEDESDYQERVVSKKPRRDDEREVAIAKKIGDRIFSEQWVKETFEEISRLQVEYLREAIKNVDDPSFVYTKTQEVLEQISRLTRAEIAEGAPTLSSVPKGEPALVMTNHLGTYKLTGIDPKKALGVNIPGYDFMYPSPMYFGGLMPVSKAIGDNLGYVSDDFPGVFGKIHRAAGFIHVPPKGPDPVGRTGELLKQTRGLFTDRPNSAIVNYPEGGTSGKYSGKGPYDLDPFKTGGYVIAAELKTRVIPVAQYFDPHQGLRLRVFPSYVPKLSDRETVQQLAEQDRAAIQEWLNECQSSSSPKR